MLILGEAGSHDLVLICTFQSNVAAYYHGGVSAKLYCTKVSHTPYCSHTYTSCICRAMQFAEMIKECDDIVFPKVYPNMVTHNGDVINSTNCMYHWE